MSITTESAALVGLGAVICILGAQIFFLVLVSRLATAVNALASALEPSAESADQVHSDSAGYSRDRMVKDFAAFAARKDAAAHAAASYPVRPPGFASAEVLTDMEDAAHLSEQEREAFYP